MSQTPPKFAVILPAAGASRRFKSAGGSTSKLDVAIAGKAALVRAVELFAGRPDVSRVVIAVDPDQVDEFKMRWADKFALYEVKVVPGGRVERWETVRNALGAIGDEATHVAVHDAARPVADPAMIDRVFTAAARFSAVIPAVPVHATVKRVGEKAATVEAKSADPLDAIFGADDAGAEPAQEIEAFPVIETVPRAGLWLVQTPQTFERKLLERAYAQIAAGDIDTAGITDDAGLVEALGETVMAVAGDAFNVKITLPEDVAFAEAVAAMRSGGAFGSTKAGDKPKRKHKTWAEMDDD